MSRLRPIVPLLPLALALAVLFHRLLLGEVFFWGLPSLQFTPWRLLAIEQLRNGVLPLWNSLSGAGAPLLANYQSALLYPLNWPSFVLPTAWAMSVTAVVHLFIAGWGMWAFTGVIGANGLGRAVSALAFGLTSYLVARAGTYPMVSAAAWLPWLMWAAHGLFGARPYRAALALGGFTALLLLAGHAQTAWYSLLLTGLYALFLAVKARRWRPLLAAGGLVGLGAAVAALQLIPTAELLTLSQRGGGVDTAYALNFSYAPVRALNLLAPNVFGSPADGTYYTEGVFFEDAVYIGLLPLIAALSAFVKWPWRRRAHDPLVVTVAFSGVMIAVAFVLALGSHTPIFPWLFEHVPTFDLFQAPVRWHLWTVFGLAVLSAVGVTWWNRGASWSRRMAAFTGAALAMGVIGTLTMPDADPTMQVLLRAVVTTSALGFCAVLLTLVKPPDEAKYAGAWKAVVLFVVALDLVWAGWGLNPTTEASFYEARPADTNGRAFWPADALETAMYDTHLLMDDYRMTDAQIEAYRESGLPNLNLLDGRELFNNFDPLLNRHYVAYLALLNEPDAPGGLMVSAGVTGREPMAWMVGAACYGDDAAVATGLTAPDWTPERLVYLMGEGECELPADGVAGEVLNSAADLTELRVQANENAWLVVSIAWYPGWQAQLDGQDVPIECANLMFRAVRVPEGEHTVTFSYQPAWLLPSALLSLAGLMGLAGVFALAWRERRYNAKEVNE